MIALEEATLNRYLGEQAPEIQEVAKAKIEAIYKNNIKGRHYQKILDDLQPLSPSIVEVDTDRISVGTATDLSANQQASLRYSLECLMPWRKGPFSLFGIDIDSEWRSDLKWDRVKDHMAPLTHKKVLDIGSSNGYYMFRMKAQTPHFVLGIEPFLTFYFQYQALQFYLHYKELCCLPLKLEELPTLPGWFDTIFCMGIMYHRRSPLDTLLQIHGNLCRGGELILETLIIEGDSELALFPVERYAKMNNVYFIPTLKCLKSWLQRTGFENIRSIDVSPTTSNEQRRTSWVDTESLADFLSPEDRNLTIEGYPAPIRAIILANAK